MRKLIDSELASISGASEGTYYFEGTSYNFTCPNVSQSCLNTYLSFLEKLPPDSTIPPASLNKVLSVCGGMSTLALISPCLDPIINQIRQQYGLK